MVTPKRAKKAMVRQTDHGGQPYTGPVTVDLTPVSAVLVDLPPGARRGLRRALPDIDAVLAELAAAVPEDGPAAGIAPSVYQKVVSTSASLAALAPLRALVVKLAEVVVETEAVLEDAREHALSQIADAVKSSARRNKEEGVQAPFQKTLAYKAHVGDKAVKTREAKAAEKAAAAGGGEAAAKAG